MSVETYADHLEASRVFEEEMTAVILAGAERCAATPGEEPDVVARTRDARQLRDLVVDWSAHGDTVAWMQAGLARSLRELTGGAVSSFEIDARRVTRWHPAFVPGASVDIAKALAATMALEQPAPIQETTFSLAASDHPEHGPAPFPFPIGQEPARIEGWRRAAFSLAARRALHKHVEIAVRAQILAVVRALLDQGAGIVRVDWRGIAPWTQLGAHPNIDTEASRDLARGLTDHDLFAFLPLARDTVWFSMDGASQEPPGHGTLMT